MFATSRLGPRVAGRPIGRDARGETCWGSYTIGHSAGSDVGSAMTTANCGRCRRTAGWRAMSPDGSGGSGDAVDEVFDEAVTQMCTGPTIELGCGPGRLVARLIQRGIPALGIDRSATAIQLAGRGGAPALLGDVFEELPGTGLWQTVLLVDGNVGLGGDPLRILARAFELLARGGRCIAEFEAETIGIRSRWVRLESSCEVGPWFRWATVGWTAPPRWPRRWG